MLELRFRDNRQDAIRISGPTLSIGKDPSNDIVISDPDISDFHAELSIEDNQVFLVDLLSNKGTYVNGQPISKRHELKVWDVIKLASVELELFDPRECRPNEWALKSESDLLSGQCITIHQSLLVGRDPECDLVISNNLLSRRHAQITVEDKALHVSDLGTTNGTFINGVRITDGYAKEGDEIRFNTVAFQVIAPHGSEDEGIQKRTDNELERTVMQSAVEQEPPAGGAIESTQVIPTVRSYLIGETEPFSGLEFELKGKKNTVGRAPDNDIVLDELSISSHHAELDNDGNTWWVTDLNSTNGTFLNNERINTGTVYDEARLRFGRVELRLVNDAPINGDTTVELDSPHGISPGRRHAQVADRKLQIPAWGYGLIGFFLALAVMIVLYLY